MYFPDKLRLVTVPNGLSIGSSGRTSPDFHALDYISKRLKFNYDVTEESNEGRLLSGLQKEFDIGMGKFKMQGSYSDYVHFTVPYYSIKEIFLCEKASEDPKFNAFLYPFSTDVWIVCLCFTLIATVVSKYVTSSKQQSVNVFLNLVGSLLKQPLEVEVNTLRKTIWWATWLVWAGIISFLYNAIFLNFLTIPTSAHSPKNFQELSEAVQNKNFKCVIVKHKNDYMLESKLEYLRLLGEIIAKNEWYLENNSQANISKTECWIGSDLVLKNVFIYPPKVKHFSDDFLYDQQLTIYVRKSFCCFEQLNKAVLDMIEGGFYQKFYSEALRNYVWKVELITLGFPDDSTKALSMEDMKYPFYLLLFCYTLCIIVFLFEILLPKAIVLKILSNKSVFK
ncbi:hypothetical protein JTE90_014279 [Oedothorax gibbosus]|uniref:Uncharacterized protein n=1 Tax=Oedothorax gibbosus TaxID=931172 RepID=A0AAV6TDL1_9ARAC|nr:hypothetical protein JTE90_014279 [Oedothorax gibbosus]